MPWLHRRSPAPWPPSLGFLWHRGYTFRHPEREYKDNAAVQGAGFVSLTLFNIGASPVVLWAALQVVPSPILLAKLVTEGLLTAETFLILHVVFRKKGARA